MVEGYSKISWYLRYRSSWHLSIYFTDEGGGEGECMRVGWMEGKGSSEIVVRERLKK